ncbi:hypothetical protein P3L10_011589 [Capsicum annuum]
MYEESSRRNQKSIVNEDDIQNIPYFKAIIKETFRLHPPAPLLLPRESMEKSTLEGYEIPPTTIIYINSWSIARDPEIWKNPKEFIPERFLNNDIDFKREDYELIPFGTGRRGCPGITLGIAAIELALSNLLYAFDWELHCGLKKRTLMQMLGLESPCIRKMSFVLSLKIISKLRSILCEFSSSS